MTIVVDVDKVEDNEVAVALSLSTGRLEVTSSPSARGVSLLTDGPHPQCQQRQRGSRSPIHRTSMPQQPPLGGLRWGLDVVLFQLSDRNKTRRSRAVAQARLGRADRTSDESTNRACHDASICSHLRSHPACRQATARRYETARDGMNKPRGFAGLGANGPGSLVIANSLDLFSTPGAFHEEAPARQGRRSSEPLLISRQASIRTLSRSHIDRVHAGVRPVRVLHSPLRAPSTKAPVAVTRTGRLQGLVSISVRQLLPSPRTRGVHTPLP